MFNKVQTAGLSLMAFLLLGSCIYKIFEQAFVYDNSSYLTGFLISLLRGL